LSLLKKRAPFKVAMSSFPSLTDLPEQVWVFFAKTVGAICGSAISIAYLLPSSKREAFLRFIIGITSGVMFGMFVGIKLAEQLGIKEHLSKAEIALSGAAMASLCAWWALGVMARIARGSITEK